MKTGIGLLRDVLAAALALALMFGVDFTQEQMAGILTFFVTVGAFATWAYPAYQARKASQA